jgi:hypothetical protein
LYFCFIGRQSITFPCSKSLFFAVFGGYIHYFNLKKQEYKCIFRGEGAYDTLAQLFNDQFWGTKFFDHHQRTFVLTYERPTFFIPDPLKPNSLNEEPNPLDERDPLDEPDPLEEPDLLEEPNLLEKSDFLQNFIIESQNKKNKKIFNKQKKLVQVIISWRVKQKNDAHNVSCSSGFINLNFTINRACI